MSSFLNFGITGNQIAKLKGYNNVAEMDMAEHPDNWSSSEHRTLGSFLSKAGDSIWTGIKNFWYKNTGQAHLTDEYKHEENLENTAYQRAAEDMQKAGLSKYMGVGAAGSPSPTPGNGLLSTALALQQLKAGKVAIDEQSWNLHKAKTWGVPTTAVDQFAKWDAIAKFLFGSSVNDIAGDEGLLTKLYNLITGGSVGSVSPVTSSAASDATAQALGSEANTVTPKPRSSSDASGPYASVFDRFSHNIGLFLRNNFSSRVPKDVNLYYEQVRGPMKGALKDLMEKFDLPFDAAAKIVNNWTLKLLGNWEGIEYALFITGTEMPSVPSSSGDSGNTGNTGFVGGGKGGGGRTVW